MEYYLAEWTIIFKEKLLESLKNCRLLSIFLKESGLTNTERKGIMVTIRITRVGKGRGVCRLSQVKWNEFFSKMDGYSMHRREVIDNISIHRKKGR